MMELKYFNKEEAKKYLAILDNDVTELRINNSDKPPIKYNGLFITGRARGYFDKNSWDDLTRIVSAIDGNPESIWTSMHECHESTLSRCKNTIGKANKATSDKEITKFSIFPIDIDSEKPVSGISATQEEIDLAEQKKNEIRDYLLSKDITPIEAFSGNGWHLIIPIEKMEANEENTKRFKSAGNIICDYFGGDSTNYNPSRMWKLYGTMSCKGSNDEDSGRIHRRSYINTPDEITRYDFNLVEKVIKDLVTEEEDSEHNTDENNEDKGQSKKGVTIIEPEVDYADLFIKCYEIDVIKIKEDTNKNIYYVTCPFCKNSDDGSLIIKNHNGPIVYKCHHKSCSDKKWKDFRAFYEEEKPDVTVDYNIEYDFGIPVISMTEKVGNKFEPRNSSDISEDIKEIIYNRNQEDELFFVHQDEIGFLHKRAEEKRVTKDYTYRATKLSFKPLGKKEMRPIINRIARFKKQKAVDLNDKRIVVDEMLSTVDTTVAEDVQLTLDLSRLPNIIQFLSRPIIDKDYNLINEGGYNSENYLYLDPERVINIDDSMSLEEADKIIEEFLSDFQFDSDADRANAIALGLTLMLRNSLPYGSLPPLFLITSDNPGSGKTTLASIIGIIAMGEVVGSTAIGESDAEMKKHLLAEADLGTEFLIFDNASTRNKIDCGTLASVVTGTKIRGRRLGVSQVIDTENKMTVCFTGNKISASGELVDRAVFIELTTDERAAERKFKTKAIISDTIANRDRLYSAFYTFFNEWKAAGANELEDTNHRQHQWEAVIGGIMKFVGEKLGLEYYGMFGDNYAKHKKASDPDWRIMTDFMKRIIADKRFKNKKWNTVETMRIASYEKDEDHPHGVGEDLLGSLIDERMGKGNDNHNRATAYGKVLSAFKNETLGSGDMQYKLVQDGRHKNKTGWRFVKTGESNLEQVDDDNNLPDEKQTDEYAEIIDFPEEKVEEEEQDTAYIAPF